MAVSKNNTSLKKFTFVWLLAGLFFAISSENTLLTLAAFGLVPLFFKLHWSPRQFPILLFILGMQWLQVTMKIFHANVMGEPVENLFVSSSITQAIWYSMAGLLVLALGMRAGAGVRSHTVHTFNRMYEFSLRQLWFAYLVSMIAGVLLKATIFAIPQLTQILLPLLNIRWVFFLLLLISVLLKRKGYQMVFIAVAFEVIIGFTGYFSQFKTVFYYLLVGYFAIRPKIGKREIILGSLMLSLVLLLSLFWTSVKVEYRVFLNQGTGQQTVDRTVGERFSWLGNAIVDDSQSSIGDSAENLASRVAYTDFFGYTIMWVPSRVDYQYGAVWGAAIRHILQPRLLFPDKPSLPSDSEQTMQYTGQFLASGEQGTSISIGYMGESYIDFGFPGMLIPIFLVGLLYGLIYRYFILRETGNGVASALVVVCLMGVIQLEMQSVKLLGSIVMTFIVYALLLKYIVPIFLPFLKRRFAVFT
ncbi:MAG: hypothetical protein IEMM0001_1918 [bacterium]|nr:MAG: hypothetical protein IEMM0001_1918 [bacterium]